MLKPTFPLIMQNQSEYALPQVKNDQKDSLRQSKQIF